MTSSDITAAIFVSQNNEMTAIFVSQSNEMAFISSYLCPKWILWDFSSILIQTFPIVLALQYGYDVKPTDNSSTKNKNGGGKVDDAAFKMLKSNVNLSF